METNVVNSAGKEVKEGPEGGGVRRGVGRVRRGVFGQNGVRRGVFSQNRVRRGGSPGGAGGPQGLSSWGMVRGKGLSGRWVECSIFLRVLIYRGASQKDRACGAQIPFY